MKINMLCAIPFAMLTSQTAFSKCEDMSLIEMNLLSNVNVTKQEYKSKETEFAYDKIYCLDSLTKEDLRSVIVIENDINDLKTTNEKNLKPLYCKYLALNDQIQTEINFNEMLAVFSRDHKDSITNGELLPDLCNS